MLTQRIAKNASAPSGQAQRNQPGSRLPAGRGHQQLPRSIGDAGTQRHPIPACAARLTPCQPVQGHDRRHRHSRQHAAAGAVRQAGSASSAAVKPCSRPPTIWHKAIRLRSATGSCSSSACWYWSPPPSPYWSCWYGSIATTSKAAPWKWKNNARRQNWPTARAGRHLAPDERAGRSGRRRPHRHRNRDENITGAIADSINYTIEELRVLVGRINDAANRVTSSTEIARKTSAELLEAAERQSQEIQEAGSRPEPRHAR